MNQKKQSFVVSSRPELPVNDIVPTFLGKYLTDKWRGARAKLSGEDERQFSSNYWSKNVPLEGQDCSDLIIKAICDNSPFAVGRLGGVEATLLMWSRGIPLCGTSAPVLFRETAEGASNAGIRPRNKASYHAFANLAKESLHVLDLMTVWKAAYEASTITSLNLHPVFGKLEEIAPTSRLTNHWMMALEGKKVLVVSPFKLSIERQLHRMPEIWKSLNWSPRLDVDVIQFPYLIDDNCKERWWDVYERIGHEVATRNYDIALLGCGGLGLPMAAIAKSAGKVGIHLGGHLQLLFGIYGQRHLEQKWHRSWINDAWIRPTTNEVPTSAQRVENSCYW